jgi:WD40 repeat protein
MAIPLSVTLKWGKQTYTNEQISILPGQTTVLNLKEQVQSLTGVPIARQKLLCPKAWKGTLSKDDNDVVVPRDFSGKGNKGSIVVTLIGSAATIDEHRPTPSITDDTSNQYKKGMRVNYITTHGNLQPQICTILAVDLDDALEPYYTIRMEDGREKQTDNAHLKPLLSDSKINIASGVGNNKTNFPVDCEKIIDIVALQLDPSGIDRDDSKKMGMYEYNRLVTGLPQHQINDMLIGRNRNTTSSSPRPLLCEVAMTMGQELRRAYINSIDVLHNGTIVSGLDDGHVQLWSRGRLLKDARHSSNCVEHVRTLPPPPSSLGGVEEEDGPSFVTAGGGMICLWNEMGEIIWSCGAPSGTSPASIACGSIGHNTDESPTYLAACFRVTREVDLNQFRLVPQNDAERQRREDALARERMIQHELLEVTRTIKLWMYNGKSRGGNSGDGTSSSSVVVREMFVQFDSQEETASITHLLHMDSGQLVSGDSSGVIRIFVWSTLQEGGLSELYPPRQSALIQFRGGYSIACLAKVHNQLLAVSLQPGGNSTIDYPSAIAHDVISPFGIYIMDNRGTLKTALVVHNDIVRCICPLPDGSLLSAGGKLDATVRLWDSLIISDAVTACESREEDMRVVSDATIMKEPGYVFDLKVLSDSNGSSVYAIAAARYNVIKIII